MELRKGNRRLFMEYIIGFLLLLVALIILGLILRKKVYDRVDKIEEWKLNVMNRDVTDQLSKIKDLNLSGETQARFEEWRGEWDYIVTRKLPDLEEDLFDAEEAADKFLFRKANNILKNVTSTLSKIEASIDKMFEEVDQLVQSKEESIKEMEEIRPRIKETRKYILQNRYQFGKAEVVFDVELDEIDALVDQFEVLTNEGNYTEAHTVVEEANARLIQLNDKIRILPVLYQACKTDIPEKLDELISAIKEMKESGHRIHHFGFEKEIHKYHEQLILMVELLDQGVIDGVQETIDEVEERIQEIYDKLEQEALAKKYTEKEIFVMHRNLEEIEKDLQKTKEEIKVLQESYHFEEEDQESQLTLDNLLKQLKVHADKIQEELDEDKKNYTYLRIELENWITEWERMFVKLDDFKQKINSLRQEELEARDKIQSLSSELALLRRKIQKSNLPGVPQYIHDAILEVSTYIKDANTKLHQHPLKIEEIQYLLSKAEKNAITAKEQTDLLFEQAQLAELVIQYANRYRSQMPILAAKLLEAEAAFRNWDYELSLEISANALEEVEPGAVERLSEMVKQKEMIYH
jgi:septation ring formation regulator